MTDPNDDMSSIADPGSMDVGSMTEPDNGNPGDLDVDHEGLADAGGTGTPGEAIDSPAAQGSPVGPPAPASVKDRRPPRNERRRTPALPAVVDTDGVRRVTSCAAGRNAGTFRK